MTALPKLAAPARRALQAAAIDTLEQLTAIRKHSYCRYMEWVQTPSRN